MTGYFSYLEAKASEADIGDRVERARLAHPLPAETAISRRPRRSVARALHRLAHGLRPTTVP